jgi:hypothetical protein
MTEKTGMKKTYHLLQIAYYNAREDGCKLNFPLKHLRFKIFLMINYHININAGWTESIILIQGGQRPCLINSQFTKESLPPKNPTVERVCRLLPRVRGRASMPDARLKQDFD